MKGKLIIGLLAVLLLAGCALAPPRVAVNEQNANVEILDRVMRGIPAPDLGSRPYERKIAVEMMGQRNTTVRSTYTYQITEQGKIISICESLGYPIPYAVQITNPKRSEIIGGRYELMDSPENNGLYMPSSAEASWIPCVFNGKVHPVYYEGRVSTFPIKIENPDIVLKLSQPKTENGIDVKEWVGK